MRKSSKVDFKNIKTKKKNNVIFIIISVAFGIYFVYTLFEQQLKLNKYDSQIDMYSQDISQKQDLTEYYENKKSNIKTDEYIESVARETLGYVKPYEKIFVDANR
jgi:cell division protein FtsB